MSTINSCCVFALCFAGAFFIAPQVHAHSEDDPLLTTLMVEQLEYREHDGEGAGKLDAELWLGYDLNKLWFKVEAERADGETEAAELQALYSRALAPNWDLQLGLRRDLEPGPGRNWAVIGLQGLAPYFFDVEATAFVGESGRTAARLEAEYELLLSQRWIATPALELNAYGHNDRQALQGSGLAEAEVGLRLRYEISRQLAPYVGVNRTRAFGNTADFLRARGEETGKTTWVVGLRGWF